MLCASYEDEPRFRELIEEWIAKEEVPSFPAFSGESETGRRARKRRYKTEEAEAEEALKEMGADTSTHVGETKVSLIREATPLIRTL